MGLDISHDAWHGPYSAFHRFRCAVAGAVGLNLYFMEGFEPNFLITQGVGDKPAERPYYATHSVSWEALKPDPLHILLNHSDCDGEIAASDLPAIHNRLVEMRGDIVTWFAESERDRMTERLDMLIAGLFRAAAAGEPLQFG